MKKSKKLIMIGASGHGKVCAEIAELSSRYDEIVFLDDSPVVKKCGKHNVIGTSRDFYKLIDDKTEFFVSIGKFEHRKRIQEKIEIAGGKVATLSHPQAVISEMVTFNIGTVVMPGAVINTGTSIGKGVIVNTSSSIDHDCTVGDWCHISTGTHLAGTVEVGGCCWIGAGATVSNNLSICSNVTVGAGAVVIKSIEESGTYIGVPVRKMDKNSTVCLNTKASEQIRGGIPQYKIKGKKVISFIIMKPLLIAENIQIGRGA